MTEPAIDDEAVDFEQLYQGNLGVGPNMPWDIGAPQPLLVELADAGEIGDDVLDVGCGLGDNAIFLASRGHRVTGVDGAPTAIRQAQERATAHGVDVEFATADATRLDGFENRFDTIVDSALYHCLNEQARKEYLAALTSATKPGARLHLICFSDELPESFPTPYMFSEADLRHTIGTSWTITRLRPALYASATTAADLLAALESVELAQPVDPEGLARLGVDEHGRLQLPVWLLTATRPEWKVSG
jgi:SAM-dependent methyltransferase